MSFERLVLLVLVGALAFIFCVILWKWIGVPIRKWLWSFLTARYLRLVEGPPPSLLAGFSAVSDQEAEVKLWIENSGGSRLLQSFFMNSGQTFTINFQDGILVPRDACLFLRVPDGVRVLINPLWRGAPGRLLIAGIV